MADGMSVRDSLTASIKELNDGTGAAEGAAPAEPVVQAAPEAAEAAAPPAEAAKPAEAVEGAPERDDKGRFKPKADQQPAQASAEAPPAETKSETAKPEDTGPEVQATRIPPSLPAAVKAQWADLKPEVREAFSKLEDTVQTAKAEWGRKGERLNRFDEILSPHLDRWRIGGLDEFSGIQTLLAAQNVLDRNPAEGLVQIARSYGLTPAHVAQAFGLTAGGAPQATGAGGQQAPTVQPDLERALAPLVERVQTLQQQFTQQSKATEAEKLASAHAEVQTFASDPANLYFENVRNDIADILQRNPALSLKDAYEKAIWADPTIRPLLLAEQAKAAAPKPDPAKEKAAQEQRKATEAARAAGSVTGAPAPGSAAPKEPPGSVRDSIRGALQELGAT